jgi:hypothetical protein
MPFWPIPPSAPPLTRLGGEVCDAILYMCRAGRGGDPECCGSWMKRRPPERRGTGRPVIWYGPAPPEPTTRPYEPGTTSRRYGDPDESATPPAKDTTYPPQSPCLLRAVRKWVGAVWRAFCALIGCRVGMVRIQWGALAPDDVAWELPGTVWGCLHAPDRGREGGPGRVGRLLRPGDVPWGSGPNRVGCVSRAPTPGPEGTGPTEWPGSYVRVSAPDRVRWGLTGSGGGVSRAPAPRRGEWSDRAGRVLRA